MTCEDPGVFTAAALRRIDDQRSLLERHPREPPRQHVNVFAVQNVRPQIHVTPFEPEWEGFVTLEISNSTPLPAKIYSNEGLCQILFFQSDEPCETSYKDKLGKYQKQSGIVLPKL